MNWLFDTSMGQPGPGGSWPLWLSVLFHTSNAVLTITYLAIPVIKLAYWPYKGTGINVGLYWKIMAYLPMMALSRGVRVLELWGPPYHLTTIVDASAAIVAVYSIYHLQGFIRHIILLPSRDEVAALREEITRRDAADKIAKEGYARRDVAIGKSLDQIQALIPEGSPGYRVTVAIEEVRSFLAMRFHSSQTQGDS